MDKGKRLSYIDSYKKLRLLVFVYNGAIIIELLNFLKI